jgi:hypothetical protein
MRVPPIGARDLAGLSDLEIGAIISVTPRLG